MREVIKITIAILATIMILVIAMFFNSITDHFDFLGAIAAMALFPHINKFLTPNK